MLSGAIRGLIFAIIASLISFVKSRINLRKCLVSEPVSSIKTFEYKGRNYDYNSYLKIRTEALGNLPRNQIISYMKEKEKIISKNEFTVLDEIELSAAKAAISYKSGKSPKSHDILTVGKDVPCGKIQIIPTKEYGGFINIYPEYPKYDDDFTRKFIKKETTIHLKNGQKILLTDSKIVDEE